MNNIDNKYIIDEAYENYTITVSYGAYEINYLAHRDKNTFYYDHNSLIGCSTINVNNKRLIEYKKIK